MKIYIAFDNDLGLLGAFVNEKKALTLARKWAGYLEVIDTKLEPNDDGQLQTELVY